MSEEGIPARIRGAIRADTCREIGANLLEAGSDFGRCGLGGGNAFELYLLLDESAADKAVQCLLLRVLSIGSVCWIEDGELLFIFEIALQNYLPVYEGDYTIDDDGIGINITFAGFGSGRRNLGMGAQEARKQRGCARPMANTRGPADFKCA